MNVTPMNKRFLIGSAALLYCALPALAQKTDSTHTRTIVVEQDYIPHLSTAKKIDVLPSITTPTLAPGTVTYATQPRPTTSIPADLMASMARKEEQSVASPGYLRLGWGNYNNLDFRAHYRLHLSPRGDLRLGAALDGMNARLEHSPSWKAHYYRTTVQADFTHRLTDTELDMGGRFGLSNFNFLPGSTAGKQKFTSADIHASLNHRPEDAMFSYGGQLGLKYYNRQHNLLLPERSSIGERILGLQGFVSARLSEEQTLVIHADLRHHHYTLGSALAKALNGQGLDNYLWATLSPRYTVCTDDWSLQLGAKTVLSPGFGTAFRLAPDLLASYALGDNYRLYASVTGGATVNDFRQLEATNPYALMGTRLNANGQTELLRPVDSFEQLNASVGVQGSPLSELRFHIYAGHRRLSDMLSYLFEPQPAATSPAQRVEFLTSPKAHNSYVGASLGYTYRNRWGAEVHYCHLRWKAENSLALVTQPTHKLDLSAFVRPIDKLSVEAGLTHRTHHRVGTYALRMPDIVDFHARVDYRLFDALAIYAQGHNLLGKNYNHFHGYPAEGASLLVGCSLQF